MIQAQGVHSPPRPTGVLSEASAAEMRPKPDGQAEHSGKKSPQILLSPLQDEIVTDAVPSPARTTETVEAPQQSDQKKQSKRNVYSTSSPRSDIPSTSRSEIPSTPKSDFSTENSQSRKESRQGPKFNTRQRREKATNETVINISNASNFVIGSVITSGSPFPPKSAEDDLDVKGRRMNQFNELLSCKDELLREDIVIVSESLTKKGLHSLLQELPMNAEDAQEIITDFKCKGLPEVIVQIVTHWKYLMSKGNQRPRLNLFSYKLLQENVYNEGGKKALEGLLRYHSEHGTFE